MQVTNDIAERIAEKIVPDCLSRTCFRRDCSRPECWGCDDSRAERERVAAIIRAELEARHEFITHDVKRDSCLLDGLPRNAEIHVARDETL